MNFRIATFAFLLCLLSSHAHAYYVGVFGTGFDPTKETHVFVIGQPVEAGDAFVQSAITTANRLHEAFPDRQILFLEYGQAKSDDPTVTNDRAINELRSFGVNVIRVNESPLLGEAVVTELLPLTKIASLEIFSHGHPTLGSALEGIEEYQRFFQGTPHLAYLKGHFISGGYVNFHGCNIGFVTAPAVSKILEVPVVGFLTSSNFQGPFSDGHWYFNDPGLFPKMGYWLDFNYLSFALPLDCSDGNCLRLAADNIPYRGDYGSADSGLGFPKFFCNYDYGNECFQAMAASLLAFPSEQPLSANSPIEAFQAAAKNLLCPSDVKGIKRATCYQALDGAVQSGNNELSFFSGPEPECSLSGCLVQADCVGRECRLTRTTQSAPTNLVREYRHYLQGIAGLAAARP